MTADCPQPDLSWSARAFVVQLSVDAAVPFSAPPNTCRCRIVCSRQFSARAFRPTGTTTTPDRRSKRTYSVKSAGFAAAPSRSAGVNFWQRSTGRTVTDLVGGSGLTFVDRGERLLTEPGESWRLFVATGAELPIS